MPTLIEAAPTGSAQRFGSQLLRETGPLREQKSAFRIGAKQTLRLKRDQLLQTLAEIRRERQLKKDQAAAKSPLGGFGAVGGAGAGAIAGGLLGGPMGALIGSGIGTGVGGGIEMGLQGDLRGSTAAIQGGLDLVPSQFYQQRKALDAGLDDSTDLATGSGGAEGSGF